MGKRINLTLNYNNPSNDNILDVFEKIFNLINDTDALFLDSMELEVDEEQEE
jgi:hypothetical protein